MSDFKINDKVTWTQVSHHGRSVSMSPKEGVVIGFATKFAIVQTKRGTRSHMIPIANLRHVGERSTLTEFCDEVFAANRERV